MRIAHTTLAALAVASLLSPLPARAQDAPAKDAGPKAPHRHWEDLKLPPLKAYTSPKAERREIDGMVVYLLEDHELPTIDLDACVRVGSVYESHEKAGLASLTGEVMRSGGTEKKTGDELDRELEGIAASAETSIGLWQGTASCGALKENFDEALAVLVDVLEHPAFREDKLQLAKKQHLSAIARRNDNPSGIASREFARALYGDDIVYGWTEERATLDAITRDDLVEFHKHFFGRDRTIIGVSGDFNAAEMAKKLEAAFAGYGKAGGPLPAAPVVEDRKVAGNVYLVKKPDVNQSTVIMGHLGIQRRADDPDYFAAIIADSILGSGGFASRLFQHVRTELGFAYSVGSSLNAPYSHRGTFRMSCQTNCKDTYAAANAMRKELLVTVSELPTAEELRNAKDGILQSIVFQSESKREVLDRTLRYEYYSFPQDYLEKFQAGIAAVTAEDVLRVAKKTFKPESLTMMIVGDDRAFVGALDEPGTQVVIDVKKAAGKDHAAHPSQSGPGATDGSASAGSAPSAAESAAKAKDLIAKAVAAHGGQAALDAVKGSRQKGTLKVSMGEQKMELKMDSLISLQGRFRQTMVGPMGRIVVCFDGESLWQSAGGQVQDAPPEQIEKAKAETKSNYVMVLRSLSAASDATYAGTASVDGKPASILAMAGQKLYLDAASNLLVRMDRDSGESMVYGDLRPAGGVVMPYKTSWTEDGAEMELRTDEITVNPEISADAFQKPAGTPAGVK